MPNAFQVTKNGQAFDYREAQLLNIEEVRKFFSQRYTVVTMSQVGRHVTGILNYQGHDVFLKLATTPGTGILLENEFRWNQEFNDANVNNNFRVPKNITSGEYNELFYIITEKFSGTPFSALPHFSINATFRQHVSQVIDFAELIMVLPLEEIGKPDIVVGSSAQEWFYNKTKVWLEAIPENVRQENKVDSLFQIMASGISNLTARPRHGDFTPWHLMHLSDGSLGLLDGEHAMSSGIEYYDLAFLIQRVHTVSNQPGLALLITKELAQRDYDKKKLQIVLAARGIGGYLDGVLAQKNSFEAENNFSKWLTSLC